MGLCYMNTVRLGRIYLRMSDLISILKAINNPVRLQILQYLKDPKANFDVTDQLVDADVEGVCGSIIQEKVGFSQSTVSSYLSTLQRAELVRAKRIGQWTYFQRNQERIDQLLEELQLQL
jgi:DNA-binding transcriptional ArsR family regulator